MKSGWIVLFVLAVCSLSRAWAAAPLDATAIAAYKQAVAAIDAENPAAAVPALERIVRRFPNPSLSQGYRPYYQIARGRLLLGDYEGAELSLAISEGLLPDKPKRKIRQSVEVLRGHLERATLATAG